MMRLQTGEQAGFDDYIDGYFPLSLSLADLLQRRGLTSALVRVTFAPILYVPDLPHDAPVPLNIRSGRAGLIEAAELAVSPGRQTPQLSGWANWRWLDGGPAAPVLDPMIRLAEPAYVTGQMVRQGRGPTRVIETRDQNLV